MKWLKEQLELSGKHHKFIIQMHIPNSANYTYKDRELAPFYEHWREKEEKDEFRELCEKYADKILIQLVAHEHKADIRLVRHTRFEG